MARARSRSGSGGLGREAPEVDGGEEGRGSQERASASKAQRPLPRSPEPAPHEPRAGARSIERARSPEARQRDAAEARQPLRLWAPWRMELLESEKPAGCIFCNFFAAPGEESDRQNLVVHRGALCFTMLNRYPYNSGHVMVVPRSHVSNLDDLPGDEYAALHDELRAALRVLRKTYRPDGMNVGMNLGVIAGAGIAEHLHYHVVPRWAGDTSFMPIMADVRVMVQHLDDAWQRIHAGFDKL